MLGISAEYYRKGWVGKPMPKGLKSLPILYKAFMQGRQDKKNGINIFVDGYNPYNKRFESNMYTDSNKRLEEAADKYIKTITPDDIPYYHRDVKQGFIAGAELGYKEAIKDAKKWLDSNLKNYLGLINEEKLTASTFRTAQLITDFDADMNKFLGK